MSTPEPILDLDAIRAAYPALRRDHLGLPVAYFDGPGGTQVPSSVVEAMSDYLLHHNANTHWVYPTSLETDAALGKARAAVADFLGGRPDEVAFGANMTTLTLHLGRALARAWKAEDEIIVTELDHHANVDPWYQLAREHGLVVRKLPFDPAKGELDLAGLSALLGPRTRLLALGAASNALGTVNDVRRAADLAHSAGAQLFIDAVHYAPHRLVDVVALGADYLACSAYKFYGPHLGILWGRHALLESLDTPRLEPAPSHAPEKLETGTQNHEGIVGAGAAVDFLAGVSSGFLAGPPSRFLAESTSGPLAGSTSGPLAGSTSSSSRRERLAHRMELLHLRGEALVARLWSGLSALPRVRLFGPPPGRPRTPTVAFVVQGVESEKVARHLASRAVFVSHGDFYATTAVRRLGVGPTGVVRAGCACYTTEEEVDRLVAAVAGVATT